MKVLVTGGAGFIGSHSVEALLASDAEVIVYDNFSTGKRENLPQDSRLTVIEGDIRDEAAMRQAVAGMSHILHLAASVSVGVSVANPTTSAGHNITGFLNMLDAARRAGVTRVVYASSAAVYGMPKTLPLTEESSVAPVSPYGLEKSVNDQYAKMFGNLYGVRSLGMRYFNVYGPRQDAASPYAGVISKFTHRMSRDEPVHVFGDGRQTRDFIFVEDVANYNVRALRRDCDGVCNVGSGISVTLLQLIDELAKCYGKKADVKFDPAVAGDIRHSAMTPGRLHRELGAVRATELAAGLSTLCKSCGQSR